MSYTHSGTPCDQQRKALEAQRDQAVQEREEWKALASHGPESCLDQTCIREKELRVTINLLRAALVKYGEHQPTCLIGAGDPLNPHCDCGFSAATGAG